MGQTHTKRILLWSPSGASTHYNGPGAFAYRLYQQDTLAKNRVTLAHQSAEQPVFTTTFDITTNVKKSESMVRALVASGRWASTNANKYDLFHGLGGFNSTVFPAWRAAQAGLPVVLFPMLSGVEFSNNVGFGRLLRLPAQRRAMIKRFHAFISMTASIEEELVSSGIHQSLIARIPMGVDCERFAPAQIDKGLIRSKLGLKDLPTVIFCGSLTRRKRPHLLLEAIKILSRTRATQTIFTGPVVDNRYAVELRSLASELPKSSPCWFLGHRTRPEDYMQASDVYCLPSLSEGQPASTLEAMASGLAIVVTRLPGLDTFVDESTAGFYANPSPASVSAQISKALDTTAHQRTRARQEIQNRCSLDLVADAHDQLFNMVIAGKTPRDASLMR